MNLLRHHEGSESGICTNNNNNNNNNNTLKRLLKKEKIMMSNDGQRQQQQQQRPSSQSQQLLGEGTTASASDADGGARDNHNGSGVANESMEKYVNNNKRNTMDIIGSDEADGGIVIQLASLTTTPTTSITSTTKHQ